jgi:hypothetical protein
MISAKPSVRLAVAAVFAGTLACVALAQPAANSAALINAALDKPIAFKLDNSPLPKVLESIEDKTGVPVRVSNDAYNVLPYGTETPITATVEHLSLRDALAAIAGKLGLRVELRQEFVELVPHPALRRLGRRVTLQELRTLDVLSSRPIDLSKSENANAMTLIRTVDASLATFDKELAAKGQQPAKIVVEIRSAGGDDASAPAAAVMLSRGATLLDALEAMAAQSKLTWYPWGDSVVVLPKRDVIRGLLERPISAHYDGVDVAQVLIDLAKKGGVEFSVEPGAIQRVPPEFRIVKLSADASLRQVLEGLQGYTGLGYIVNDDGIYLWNQNSSPPAAAGRGRVVATVTIAPGATALVREEDLSQAARDVIETKRKAAAQALEASLVPTGPTTEPAHN